MQRRETMAKLIRNDYVYTSKKYKKNTNSRSVYTAAFTTPQGRERCKRFQIGVAITLIQRGKMVFTYPSARSAPWKYYHRYWYGLEYYEEQTRKVLIKHRRFTMPYHNSYFLALQLCIVCTLLHITLIARMCILTFYIYVYTPISCVSYSTYPVFVTQFR